MTKWFTADRIVGLILLAASIVFLFMAYGLAESIAPIFRRNPMRLDTMPKIIGYVAVIASLITILMPNTDVRKSQEAERADEAVSDQEISFGNILNYDFPRLGLMIALMCVFALTLKPLGFIPATAVFLFLGSFSLGERRWLLMVFVSIIAPLLIWLLVTYVLDRKIAPLPSNLWAYHDLEDVQLMQRGEIAHA